jgi:uncharacterized membrane protein
VAGEFPAILRVPGLSLFPEADNGYHCDPNGTQLFLRTGVCPFRQPKGSAVNDMGHQRHRDMNQASPSSGALHPGGFASVLSRNIDVLRQKRAEEQKSAGFQDRIAAAITRFAGSMTFVYIHLVLVVAWVAINLGWLPVIPAFDPTFVILATFASVEAIFLSTFVLISQNRDAAAAERRAELDLQTNLLSEHEITRLLSLTVAIAERLGIEEAQDPSLKELQRHVAPEKVLDKIADEAGQPGE